MNLKWLSLILVMSLEELPHPINAHAVAVDHCCKRFTGEFSDHSQVGH